MDQDIRLGFVGIIVERKDEITEVNRILSLFSGMIRGRIGIPNPEERTAVIGLIVWLSAGGSNFSKAAGVNTGAMLPFSQILLGLFGVLDFTQNRKPTEVSTKNTKKTKNTKNGKKAKK